MALTDYDKKNLSSSDQKKIQQATDKWNAANAKGDKAGMAAAAAEAAAVRNNAGYKTDDTGKYTGSYSPSSGGSSSGGSTGGSSNKTGGYSQYTAPSLGDTWDSNTDYQAIINNAVNNGDYVTAAKAEQLRNKKIIETGSTLGSTNLYKGWLDNTDYSTQMWEGMRNGMSAQEMQALYNGRYGKANGTVGLDQYKDDELMKAAEIYIQQQLALEKQQNAMDEWEQENQRPTNPTRDPRIDEYLNQILNREGFSYNAMDDPLYQQYAEMYHREGDRAMRNTLAEAATGAGGMNTYAMTAAMQANNYYNSQLGDKIPELYQLAYDMYLNELELKVQDLGILQDMDATQYNRYRDTINDWYADKNFAYKAYTDAVNQGNWQTQYNYNSDWDNRYFDNENYWKGIENGWREKEYTDNRADIDYERNEYAKEQAKEEMQAIIATGNMPSDELIAKSGWSRATVEALVAQAKADLVKKATSGGGSGKGNGNNPKGDPVGENTYTEVAEHCKALADKGDNYGAAAFAREALDNEIISQEEYQYLLMKYNPALEGILSTGIPALDNLMSNIR